MKSLVLLFIFIVSSSIYAQDIRTIELEPGKMPSVLETAKSILKKEKIKSSQIEHDIIGFLTGDKPSLVLNKLIAQVRTVNAPKLDKISDTKLAVAILPALK